MLRDPTTVNNTYINSGSRTPASNGESSSASAAQLQRRLAELEGQNGQIDEDFTHPSPRDSPRQSYRLPRAISFRGSYRQSPHNSQQHTPHSPQNHTDYAHSVLNPGGEYDMDALARTPSYSTAVRTPMNTPPSTHYQLPTYDIAISTPNSPQHMPVQPPPRAYIGDHSGVPRRRSSPSGSSDGGSMRNFLLGGSNTTVERPEQAHGFLLTGRSS
jgi:hypothetical protein